VPSSKLYSASFKEVGTPSSDSYSSGCTRKDSPGAGSFIDPRDSGDPELQPTGRAFGRCSGPSGPVQAVVDSVEQAPIGGGPGVSTVGTQDGDGVDLVFGCLHASNTHSLVKLNDPPILHS
jgi:hypothetical protein